MLKDTFEIELEHYSDRVKKLQEGGNYEIPSFLPVERAFTPVRMNFNAQEGDFLSPPPTPKVPSIDYDGLNKLQGKGHTNDVNNYINQKRQAQQRLQGMISKYGYEFTKLPAFTQLVNEMKVSPNELNELVQRKKMSDEFASINKENGGENEWVTDANGSVLVQDIKTRSYKYVSPFELSQSNNLSPITSSDAINLNDVDPTLTMNSKIMPAVSQVWGGDKSLKHLNSQLDKIGKTEWKEASEALGGLGNINGENVFGTSGSETAGSSNEKQVAKLYSSLMSTLDTGAKNYFRNKAVQSIGKQQDLDLTSYQSLVNQKMGELVLGYVGKVIETSFSSKSTVDVDASLTKGVKGGVGFDYGDQEDFLMSVAKGFHMQDQGTNEHLVDAGWDQTSILAYDPKTGQMGQTKAYMYTDLRGNQVDRVQSEKGTNLTGTRVQFNADIPITLKGGIQAGVQPKLLSYTDSQGNRKTKAVSGGIFKVSDLEGETFMMYDKEKKKYVKTPIVKGGDLHPEAARLLKADQILGDQLSFGVGSSTGQKKLQNKYDFTEKEAEAIVSEADGTLGNDNLYYIPFMDDFTPTQAHQISESKKATTEQLSKENQIKLIQNQQAQQQQNQVEAISNALSGL